MHKINNNKHNNFSVSNNTNKHISIIPPHSKLFCFSFKKLDLFFINSALVYLSVFYIRGSQIVVWGTISLHQSIIRWCAAVLSKWYKVPSTVRKQTRAHRIIILHIRWWSVTFMLLKRWSLGVKGWEPLFYMTDTYKTSWNILLFLSQRRC